MREKRSSEGKQVGILRSTGRTNVREKKRWHLEERWQGERELEGERRHFAFLARVEVCLNVLLSHMSLRGQKLVNSVAMLPWLRDEERVVERGAVSTKN